MSRRLLLVRHGQSLWNIDRRLTGHTDVPLSDEGRAQARALRAQLQNLRVDHVWSSDLQRAIETAELSLGSPRLDARLREIHFGAWEGLAWHELAPEVITQIRDFTTFRAPGGESYADLRARVTSFLAELAPGTHAIVAHVGTLRSILDASAPTPIGNAVPIGWDLEAQRMLPLDAFRNDGS